MQSEKAVSESRQKSYFLFVGRLEEVKGAQTLIPVFRRYQKAQLWIAGTGSCEPRPRQLADDSDNIRFLGHLADKQLRSLYRNAVALIVPSICFETFSLDWSAHSHETSPT